MPSLSANRFNRLLSDRLTDCVAVICSTEHEWHSDPKTLAVPHQPTASETVQASQTTGTESMAKTSPKTLKAILETIRERADYALKQLQMPKMSVRSGGSAR